MGTKKIILLYLEGVLVFFIVDVLIKGFENGFYLNYCL